MDLLNAEKLDNFVVVLPEGEVTKFSKISVHLTFEMFSKYLYI